ncbi:endopolyphosphatase [Crucibulum laeve]|uniref:Endopolyphosphatase n=1 Tax=Crucibulum laeve TaxID=68775 RepID=A0A5C3MDW6_9AGAR|nr:endopolyphosphatase [Crucibulum laeve]
MFALHQLLLWLAVGLEVTNVFGSPAQLPLQMQQLSTKPRRLHGRFLHITDMHPDPYYAAHRSQSTACHRKKPKKKKDGSGYYGTPYSECDSPFRLTNFTLDYLETNWANEIDFVIWTGDNARHDNDRKLPRTPAEIYDLNRSVAGKMKKIFTKRGIPVIPSLGNNDVWPHNILEPGPNSITNEFSSIWSTFIPFPYLQVFQRGAYYSVEVVPDELAVISLNSMYFYDSNKAVSGCPYVDREDPGNLQFDWLEVQLKMYRQRNMQVWLTGHVPPSPGNYFPECYVRYVELSLRFQDTILGHLYGHMNVDHFFFIEASDLQIVTGDEEKPASHTGLFETLLQDFEALPGSKKADLDEYGVINVAPAVVPNPYLPSFRIFSYNVSATDGRVTADAKKKKDKKKKPKRKHGHRRGKRGDKSTHCKLDEYRNSWLCHLSNEAWNSDANAPSRANQRWTPLGFAQYNVPNLDDADKTHPPRFELEYLTYALNRLHPPTTSAESKTDFVYPIPLKQLPEGLRDGSVNKSKLAPYGLDDLTIGSWVKLGRRLGDEKHAKLRKRFRRFMFAGGKEE